MAYRGNERASDRIDLVNRVFKQKLNSLLDDIVQKKIFGRVIGWTYSIEFQKRGKPHAHILVIIHPEDKPKNPVSYHVII